MRIYEDSSKIRQLLMTSFPVENDDESKKFSVWLKILSWTFTCNNQICIILFLLGPGITGLRPCFQFSNWKKSTKTDSNWASKSCSILSRVHRIRWACPFFPSEKFGRSSKLKLKATNIMDSFDSLYTWLLSKMKMHIASISYKQRAFNIQDWVPRRFGSWPWRVQRTSVKFTGTNWASRAQVKSSLTLTFEHFRTGFPAENDLATGSLCG